MKYEITYETEYGSGNATVNGTETELYEMIATLRNSGCSNISHKMVIDYNDPCQFCHKDSFGCHGCEHAGK